MGTAGVPPSSLLRTIVVLPNSKAAAVESEAPPTNAGADRDLDDLPDSFSALLRSGLPDAPSRPGERSPDLPQPLLEVIRIISQPTGSPGRRPE